MTTKLLTLKTYISMLRFRVYFLQAANDRIELEKVTALIRRIDMAFTRNMLTGSRIDYNYLINACSNYFSFSKAGALA